MSRKKRRQIARPNAAARQRQRIHGNLSPEHGQRPVSPDRQEPDRQERVIATAMLEKIFGDELPRDALATLLREAEEDEALMLDEIASDSSSPRPARGRALARTTRPPVASQPPPLDSYRRPSELIGQFKQLMACYPVESTRRYRRLEAEQFQIKQVFRDGLITAEFIDDAVPYQLFIDTELLSQIPAGCSCEASDGQAPCEHSYSLLNVFCQQLGSASGELWQRIQARRFDKEKPSEETFQFDASSRALRQLSQLSDVAPPAIKPQSLPAAAAPAAAQRLAWSLQTSYPRGLRPAIQQRSKKGDRWLKAKPIDWDTFLRMDDLTEPTDLKLRSLLTRSQYSLEMPLIQALPLLQGDDRFHLDGYPATIQLHDAALELILLDGRWEFVCPAFEQAGEDYAELHSGFDGSVWQQGPHSVGLMPLRQGQYRLFRTLLAMDPVSRRYEDTLFEHCRRLSSQLDITLPAHAQPPLPTAHYRPAILLRSNPDGSLSYGWRLRGGGDGSGGDDKSSGDKTSGGQLLVPGDGPLLLGDGPPQQWRRSFSQEQQLVQSCARRLQLPTDSVHGTISDFSQAMQLLTGLREQEETIEVLWDSQSAAPLSYVGTITPSNLKVSIERKRDWFQLNGMCQLGDRRFKLKEIIDAVAGDQAEISGQFIRIGKGDWAQLSEELKQNLQRLHRAVNVERGAMKFDHTSAHEMRELQRQLPVDAHRAWSECLQRLEQAETLDPQLPAELKADLREYQVDGFKWMRRLAEWGVGGVLADDMGLGKTVQTIAVLIDRAPLGPSLVVAPTSVGFNWNRELQRFAPHLRGHLYRETDRDEFLTQLGPGDVVICSYGLALRDSDKLKDVAWGSLVLDEAQAIKNSRSKTAQAVAELDAAWTIALTGTPVENHLGELWSLFRCVSPGVFGPWEQFRKRFAAPIERGQDETSKLALQQRLRPFVLRRTKNEVLKDLPARTESSLTVELSAPERKLYDRTRLQVLDEAQSIAMLPDTKDQRFKILALITRLRQLACHPGLVDPQWNQRSSKLQLLADTLNDLKAEGHRVLVFSQFVQHLQLIRQMLDEEQISYQYLDGTTPAAKRQEQVDRFQTGDATAFLISLKAGGTGLNLTAADYVIHMDPWWNPAVEDQATDRAHRIGQTKPVMVYRLISEGTIEEEILKLHDSKRDLIAGVLEGASQAAKLSTADLVNLIRES